MRVFRSVYRDAAFPVTARQKLVAASIWGGEGTVVSHRAAAAEWGLDGVECRAVEITMPSPRRSPFSDLVVHRSTDLSAADRTRLGILTITSVTRTLIDLGSCEKTPVVELALDSALRRGLTTTDRLTGRLEAMSSRGRAGPAVLRALLGARSGAAGASESALETMFATLIRRSRLPIPIAQYVVGDDEGRAVARVDFAYPDRRLAVELDGYRYHHGRRIWQRDIHRRSALAAMGWRVMHFSYDDVKSQPDGVVLALRRALAGPS